MVISSPADYQIIDTPGSSGATLTHLQKADLIVVPFRPHYADLQTTIT
jgi:cellulose biosynthesis protein BcsQ